MLVVCLFLLESGDALEKSKFKTRESIIIISKHFFLNSSNLRHCVRCLGMRLHSCLQEAYGLLGFTRDRDLLKGHTQVQMKERYRLLLLTHEHEKSRGRKDSNLLGELGNNTFMEEVTWEMSLEDGRVGKGTQVGRGNGMARGKAER